MTDTQTISRDEQRDMKIPCEVYSRIVGYLRPTRNWNAGKKEEFEERQMFDRVADEALEDNEAPWDEAAEEALEENREIWEKLATL